MKNQIIIKTEIPLTSIQSKKTTGQEYLKHFLTYILPNKIL